MMGVFKLFMTYIYTNVLNFTKLLEINMFKYLILVCQNKINTDTYSINKPPCFDFKYFHNGCASSPLTLTFSNKSNLTFFFSAKLQILSASPGSCKI